MYLLDDKKMVHLISWHQIKSDKDLANDLLEIKQAGLIPEDGACQASCRLYPKKFSNFAAKPPHDFRRVIEGPFSAMRRFC